LLRPAQQYDEEETTVIRRRIGSGGATAAILMAALAWSLSAGCGSDGRSEEAALPGTPAMSEEDYVAYVAALTIAVEEGLSGEAASARIVELGGHAYTRREVEETAAALRERPETWLALEGEVDERIAELRQEIVQPGAAGAGQEAPAGRDR
jgi:hypothetical protein